MKIAVLLQSELFITALTSPVTNVWPSLTSDGGCSDTSPLGTSHETAGRLPCCAAEKKYRIDSMLPSCPSFWTSVKDGSGFQIPGVCGPCWTGAQLIEASFSQSGSVPVEM